MSATEADSIRESIRSFINRSVNIDGLGDDENLFEAGFVNSLFAIQLTTFIEKEFGLEVGPEDLDMENFKSINAAAAFVARKTT